LVSVVKNEIDLISEFLNHYRGIGVECFHIIDNDSTDGTLEFLMDQKDVTVYQEFGDYRVARYGLDWIDAVLQQVGRDRWAIHADCDEHLIFPDVKSIGVEEFAWRQDESGYDSCRAILLDMYHDKNIDDQSVLTASGSIYDRFQYFDRDYLFRREPKRPWERNRIRPFQIIGGPRYRIVSNIEIEKGRGWIDMLLAGQVDRFIDFVPEKWLPALFRHWPYYRAALHKRPLNRIHPNTSFINGHDTTNASLSPTLLGVLHFKLCHELVRCFAGEAINVRHYRRGLENEQLRLGLLSWPHKTLLYEGSCKYEGPDDLINAGLMGDHHAEIVRQ